MTTEAALEEIKALKLQLGDACDALLSQAEQGLALVQAEEFDRTAISEVFNGLVALCSFQDLAGQRLTRLAGLIAGSSRDARSDAALLNGPANAGGLDQAAADALFAHD